MAVPTVVAVGTVAATAVGGGSGPISPGLPAGWAADDIHVVFMESSNEPVTLIAGWSLAGSGFVAQSGGLITGLTVWWRRAVAGDTAPSITGPANHLIARIIGARGCVTTGDPWDVTSYTTENVADTTVSIASVSAVTATGVLALWGVATGQDTATAQGPSTWTNASVTGVATQMNDWSTTGDGGGFSVGSGARATAGALGPATGTILTANFKAQFLGALKGAASSPYPRPRRTHPNRLR